MTDMTYGRANDILNAISRLEALAETGQAGERELRALETLQASRPQAEQAAGETRSTYRGFQRGASLGLSDDIAGVSSMVTGGVFQEGREQSLQRDREARQFDPEGFSTGQMAGGGAAAGITMGVGAPAIAGGTMLGKTVASGIAGGGIGAMQGQSEYEMDGSPEGQRLSYYAAPTAVGMGTGVASPLLARGAGAITRGIRNKRATPPTGYGARPNAIMSQAVGNTENAGQDIRGYLDSLTDEAMPVDVPGDIRTVGQGLASMPGEGGSRLARAVNERGQGAGARITDDVDTAIAPANAAFQARRARAAERTSVLGPQYDAALASTAPVDISRALANIEARMSRAGTDTQPVLRGYFDDLSSRAEDGLIRAEDLHWIRSDLSDRLAAVDGPSKKNALLNQALQEIDGALDTVPGYAQARTDYGNSFAMDRATDEGQSILRGGRATAMEPDEFRAYFNGLSEAQQEALRTGLRRDIAGLMGTARNDAAAAWGDLQKGWNVEKLQIALGNDVADGITRRLRSEQVFSETRGKIDSGSETARRTGAREALRDITNPETGQRPGPIARARDSINAKGNDLVDALVYGARNDRANAELGEMLTLTGESRDELVSALLQASRVRQQPSRLADGTESILRALLAGGGGAMSANAARSQ